MRCGCGECVYEWYTLVSGVLSSTGDVLVRGVGGVCDMCMCLARGGAYVHHRQYAHIRVIPKYKLLNHI